MNLRINYIDTRRAAIAILRDWHNQQYRIDHAAEDIERIGSSLERITPSYSESGGHGSGGNSVEERLASGLHKKQIIEYGYTEAKEYMTEFNAAWDQLTDEEQYILDVRFRGQKQDGIKKIMERFFISRSEAYNRSEDALRKFTVKLFW